MKNIKLFFAMILIALLIIGVGYSFKKGKQTTLEDIKVEIFEEVKQEVYNSASNAVVSQIVERIDSKGEIVINLPDRQIILVEKVVLDNLNQKENEE